MRELDKLIEAGSLVFPPEVVEELRRFIDSKEPGRPDDPLAWAERNEAKATRHGRLYDQAKAVLARVPVVDPTRVSVDGVEEADPYVLALAVEIRRGGEDVGIVTDDTRRKPRKMALSDAAGVFHISSVTFRTFLIYEENIWDGVEGT